MDYLQEVKDDVKAYLENNFTEEEYNEAISDEYEFADSLNDDLWAEDSVTGNGSGSYTFNREEAKQNLLDDGFETIADAIDEGLYTAEELGNAIIDGDWETVDVICRCYVLRRAIGDVLSEHPKFDF